MRKPEGRRRTPLKQASRAALTLVELLVVIVILTTLVTTAIPILSPGGDERMIREASRQINTFLAGAQARAVQTGRPYGVELKRLSADTGDRDDNGVCIELRYVEVPAPYAGFSENSGVQIARRTDYNPNGFSNYQATGPFLLRFVNNFDLTADLVPPSFLRENDLIETHGHTFRLIRLEGSNNTVELDAQGFFQQPTTQQPFFAVEPVNFVKQTPWRDLPQLATKYDSNRNWLPSAAHIVSLVESGKDRPLEPYWTAPATYKIYRQPTRASGAPIQLPRSAAIDLQASGFSNDNILGLNKLNGNTFHIPGATSGVFTDSVVLMFSPEGSLMTATYPYMDTAGAIAAYRSVQKNVSSSLALCVGRRELIPAEAAASRNETEPLQLSVDLNGLTEEEQIELRNKYNWLNLESRWVVIGAQSGSINTIPNAFVNPNAADVDLFDEKGLGIPDGKIWLYEQLIAARSNAPRRTIQGGR